MEWIKAKRDAGILTGWCFRTQTAIGVEIIGGESRALQRKSCFIAPLAAMTESAVFGFSAIAAAHDEELHRRFLVYAVVCSLEPVIEPRQSPIIERQCRFSRKLDFAGNISTLAAVRPRSDDQLLRRFLVLGEHLPIEHILPAPRVVPAGDVVDGHVGITADVVHD